MIVRFDSVSAAPRAKRAQGRRAIRATVAAASFLFCGLAAAQGGASAAPGTASAASSAAAAVSVAGQYTVRPGQSLHDVAVDVTQSHDKATLARMSQVLFDANPNAFIKQDPSRMRVGAALNVPATPDVSSAAVGMTVASGGAAAASAAASTSAAAATAPVASAASASTAAAASSATAEAVAAASSATAAATAGASSASAAAATAAPASAVAASGPEASTQGASGAATGASAAAPASAASDSHVWSGSIQSAPAPASGAAGASAQGAKVSSLQQLLALKNRVLMALQQHGIGKPAQTAGGASPGAPAAQGGAPVQNGVVNAGAAGAQPEVSPIAMGAVTAVVVALLALFVRLLMRKRKKPADQASEVSPEAHEPTPSTSSATAAAAVPVAEEPPVLREPITHAGHQPDAHALAPAAQAEFVPPVAPEADEVAITPVPTPDVSSAPLEHDETAAHAASAAGVNTTTGLEADALPPTLTETLHPGTPQEPSVAQEGHTAQALPHGVEPDEPQTLADATEAASLAAAAELGADALPPESIGAPRAAEDAEALARTLEEPARAQKPAAPDIALDFGDGAPQAAQTQQASQAEPPIAQTPPITEAFERPPAPLAAPDIPSVPAVTAEDMNYAEVPIAFPHDAIEALGGLDLPLPPRIGEPVIPTEPLSTEPAATPEASARLSSPFFEPPPSMAGAAIEAGTAGAGALAGLGAPRFGALTLDFDLNLPPDSAEPLPVFTPEQLARIARNKLDLAHEYIALGDVSGARSLINEVIESNDPATRSDAQALLSTLAPLS